MMGGWSDQFNLISKTTTARAWNAFQIFSSFRRSRRRRHADISGLPISLSFEPTTSCNLRCPECPSGLRAFTRPTGMLEQQVFTRVIDELAPTLSYLTFYFQGEPYLHPRFLDMVRYASSKGIYTATSTNAHYLKDDVARQTVESGLDRLIISIDGTTQDTYQAYRVGGSLDKVIEGTQNILKWKRQLKSRTPYVIFQFLVVKPNEHQIPQVQALGKSMGVDQVVLKTAQIYDYVNGSPLIPTQEQYSRYQRGADGTYHIKNQWLDHCWKMWHSCVITWDGKVVPCCFDKDAHYVLGDLQTQTFASVWQGDAYRQFRQQLLHARQEIDICRNCTEGTRVWA